MSEDSFIDLGDLDLKEVPYRIGGQNFTLREASGEAACLYRNAITEGMELGPDGKPSKIGKIADVEPLLVSLCLYNDANHRITVVKIKEWPNRIIKKLFNKAKEISELGEESDERIQLENALNSPGSPCGFSRVQQYVASLKGENYSAVRTWIGQSVEESAKNGQSDMEDGSG